MPKSSTRRRRTQLGAWRPGDAILYLILLLLLASPLQGQGTNATASDPFGSLQKNLDLAADAQLALARTPNHPAVEVLQRSAVALEEPRQIEPTGGTGLSIQRDSLEQRFRGLGVGAWKIFTEVGVPIELLAVAKVESNFNPFAVSPKGALGLWQLMPATARRYGLQVDANRDDRLDAEKSTHAALRYLRDLHAQFGDWTLALAAYNAGEDAVERAIERTKTRNFNLVAQAGVLPLETQNYVFAVLNVMGAIRPISARYGGTGTRKSSMAAIVYAADHVEN